MKQLGAAHAISLCLGVSSASAGDSKEPQYLFSISAKSGTYAADTLTLKDVPLVVYFTDRPQRSSGHMDLGAFVETWDEGGDTFKKDPPNAELSIFNGDGDKHAVLIVDKPVVSADDISFDVTVLNGDVPGAFGHATLFIDPKNIAIYKKPVVGPN